MALNPQSKMLLDAMNAAEEPKLYEMPVNEARVALTQLSVENGGEVRHVKTVENLEIPGPAGTIPIRIYWPESSAVSLPVLVFYHGGGFALGDLDSHDNICRALCNSAKMIVVNVDYHQPPEHPFPAAPEDAYAALKWAAANSKSLGGDKTRIAVAGDSAGGNLAAVVCHMAKDNNGPDIAYQVLCYPGIYMNPEYQTASRREFGGGEYFLGYADMHWICGMYFSNPEDAKNPYASPLLADDFSDLPPALVLTAGNDMLRDEGRDYAGRLRAAGVETEYHDFEGTIHGFISFNDILDDGKDALALIAKRLQEKLG